MNNTTAQKITVLLTLAFALVACETNPPQFGSVMPAKAELQFADFQGFDRDLTGSLSAALPERWPHWMASVEAGGGTVKVKVDDKGDSLVDKVVVLQRKK